MTVAELIIALGGSSLLLGVVLIGGSAFARSRAQALVESEALRKSRTKRSLRHDMVSPNLRDEKEETPKTEAKKTEVPKD